MSVQVVNDIYWVGAVDWDVRRFHGFTYSTRRGTTYNAYLVLDEKIALIDSVYAPFKEYLIERIRELIDPSEIDYVIANHLEVDHSGAITEVLRHARKAVIVGTDSCRTGFSKYFPGDWNFKTVKTGDEIDLGRRSLNFIEAPMLHWPDTMFTYIPEEHLLLPNDAFGQHLATMGRFDDEVDHAILISEARKYFAGILWPLSLLIKPKIEEIQQLGVTINMIAPSHGVIWRKDSSTIMDLYLRWARGEAENRVIVIYDTMYGSTEMMARKFLDGLASAGVEGSLYRLPLSDTTEIFGELLNAKGLMVGSSTVNNSILPSLSPFLEDVKGLKPRNRLGFAFGSYGWGGGATGEIEKMLKLGGVEVAMPSYTVKWAPSKGELDKCFQIGRKFASHITK